MSKLNSQVSFQSLSRDVTQNFLQTVMVVDDQAFYEEFDGNLKDDTSSIIKINKPPKIEIGKKVKNIEESVPSPLIYPKADEKHVHKLNAKILTDAFADMGIACSVIRPKDNKETDLEKRVLNLAQKSDIVIFDWILSGDDSQGKKISNFISKITKNSINENKRLRLIAIYTGNSDLDTVLTTIADKLTSDSFSIQKDEENLMITVEAVKILVFAKKYAEIPEGSHFYDRKIDESSMPSRLINDFTEMTAGLVSNVALQSFATIRNNTHHILAKFRPELDAPFLAHRLMLPHPSDANEHLANLIGAEITALLEGKRVGDFADICFTQGKQNEFLGEWVKQFNRKKTAWHKFWNKMIPHGRVTKKNVVEAINNILSQDAGCEERLRKYLVKPNITVKQNEKVLEATSYVHTLEITKKFIENEEKAEALDKEFAFLTAVSSFYKEKPLLKFGTILKEITNPEKIIYWLCVQPLCDCVRISNKRKFPFLNLRRYDGEKHNKFDIVILDGEYICASVQYRQYDTEYIYFKPDRSKSISSKIVNSEFIFESVSEKKIVSSQQVDVVRKFKWLGELKFAQAQRIANQYASNMSRVGLDESEWLRRWATFGKTKNHSSSACGF